MTRIEEIKALLKSLDNTSNTIPVCQLLGVDIPWLIKQIEIAVKALEFYAKGSPKMSERVPGMRLEFGCGCCAGIEDIDGSNWDKDVVGLTAREALAAIQESQRLNDAISQTRNEKR